MHPQWVQIDTDLDMNLVVDDCNPIGTNWMPNLDINLVQLQST